MTEKIITLVAIDEFINEPVFHPSFKGAKKALRFAISTAGDEAISPCLIGPPGSGKTFLSTHVENEFPPSSTDEQDTHPVIKISMRAGAKKKDIYKAILKKLGMEISRYKDEDLEELVVEQLLLCGVKLIIIDEFHHLIRNDKIINIGVCDAIKKLIDDTKVPIALIGTERGKKLLDINDEIRDRYQTPYHIEPMSAKSGDAISYFQSFMKKKMQGYPMKTVELADREGVLRLLLATGGSLRKLRYLLKTVLKLNRNTPDKTLTFKDYQEAYALISSGSVITPSGSAIQPFTAKLQAVKNALGVK